MEAFALLAEQRIQAAIRDGEFDNLPFHGKPLQVENDAMIPPALRMGYKILRNAGVLPEEMRLKKEITELLQTLRDTPAESRRKLQMQISLLETRYQVLMARHCSYYK
mgnify:CR=1 FL=1